MFTLNGNFPSQVSRTKIAILGSHTPRQCGIATFSADLAGALCKQPDSPCVELIAVNDRPGYNYCGRVCWEIDEKDIESYGRAARYINRSGFDLLSIQHEFGIFGGEAGSHLMSLVREIEVPIVTTFHTVLEAPDRAQRRVMDELAYRSERVVVMSERAVELLKSVHSVPADKIDLIHHGVPSITQHDPDLKRNELSIEGPMILTFGLMSADKGIEFVIEAMPRILETCPSATYVILGATHPNVVASEGEQYRESLENFALDLRVSKSVRFVNRFVSNIELGQFLAAMDFYVTPYLNPKQITSGTLAYALGAGKAVVSTPYAYAVELLSMGRGALVPFRDADAIADNVVSLISNPKQYREMSQRAAAFGKQMQWPSVGMQYLSCFVDALGQSSPHVDRAAADRLEESPNLTFLSSPIRRIVQPPSVRRRPLPEETTRLKRAWSSSLS